VPADRRPLPELPHEADLLAALRTGDESTFATLIDAWSPGLLRTAQSFVAGRHTAEDVVQETWIAVLRGLDRFEGRATVRTWIYQILVNIAKDRGRRDARLVPTEDLTGYGTTVDPDLFRGTGDPYPGHWRTAPEPWPTPESSALDAETRRTLEAALRRLPPRQRVVITLRDVQGYGSDEVCQILDITPENQRVLLHRARAAVRAALSTRYGHELVEERR
jgi:RNA polymerase sigma-70 factor, ECF subfamily